MNSRLEAWRWRIAIGLVMVVGIGSFAFRSPNNSDQRAVAATRLELQKQGFKTDVADFDASTSPQSGNFEAALLASSPGLGLASHRLPVFLMMPAGSDAAIVVWKQGRLFDRIPWSEVAAAVDERRLNLDAICEAALFGRIGFDVEWNNVLSLMQPQIGMLWFLNHGGGTVWWPDHGRMQLLGHTLGIWMMLELRDGRKDAAWTNLLASTRLVTAWEPEPVEEAHWSRLTLAKISFDNTWQALQAGCWCDDRLAHLQQEWESVDFFRGLPETAAFKRVREVALCERERRLPFARGTPLTGLFKKALRSPRAAWAEVNSDWRQARYRNHGSFEDERALLLFYRDRELELRHAVKSPTWLQMRRLPGATKSVPFRSKYPSIMQAMLNAEQPFLIMEGRTVLGAAAVAEARRRLLVTAIALERFRGRHGAYPKSLSELVPELLGQPPADFIDGQPLSHRLTEDTHFVLSSLGMEEQRLGAFGGDTFVAPREDLVWPRPASVVAVGLMQHEEMAVKPTRR